MIPYCIMVIENDDDRDFMTILYEKYNRLMYSEIKQILNDSWIAEDVMHSTVEKLIDKVEKLRTLDRDHLVNYIIVASRNQAKNYIRDNKKHAAYSFDEVFDLPDQERSREAMEFKLIHIEDLYRLPKIWDQLDERSRYLLNGYYIQEKTMTELAAELKIKPESVRMALSRARKTAFRLMDPENH